MSGYIKIVMNYLQEYMHCSFCWYWWNFSPLDQLFMNNKSLNTRMDYNCYFYSYLILLWLVLWHLEDGRYVYRTRELFNTTLIDPVVFGGRDICVLVLHSAGPDSYLTLLSYITFIVSKKLSVILLPF
jgi:hypothetical protein